MKTSEAQRKKDGSYNRQLLNDEEKTSLLAAIQTVKNTSSMKDSVLIECNYIFSDIDEATGNYCFYSE